ncbi:MAG: DUF2586 family protein [Flavobacteriaceae bacterium]|nr:DUF2586 family protein [Flavobacteriaceae bacterium]
MSNLNGVSIQKGKVGANRLNNDRAVSALIVSSPANAQLPFKQAVKIYSLFDAETYGITAEADLSSNTHVYRHVREFFRMAGEGTELNLMIVPQAETLLTITTDAAGDIVKALLINGDYKVRQLAIATNPTVAPTIVDGLPSDLLDAIQAAQGIANWAFTQFMPLQIILEGRSITGSAVVQDLRDPAIDANKVTVVNGQDWQYADLMTGEAKNFADVGTVLGVLSAAGINQNIGDNEAFNITDSTKGVWVVPGLSNHAKIKDAFQELQTYENKGYVFGITYAGLAGVRINNDHVSAPIVIDAEGNLNEHTISLGRVVDDAVRQLRAVYLPKIKKTYPVDENGKIPAGLRISLESIGDQVFADMQRAGEISIGKATINPNSDLLVAKQLIVTYRIVPTGQVGEIIGTINLKNELN